ncbi:hypothetical protein GCM10027294_52690 [Marinactinospora endophytica]
MADGGPMHTPEEIDYRLAQECGETNARDAALDYRLNAARGIERLGGGWNEFGREAGTVLASAAEVQEVREIMSGRDPRTRVQLVRPKMAVDPRAKLPARPLVSAVTVIAEAAHETVEQLLGARLAQRYRQMERGLIRDGEAHQVPVRDLEAIAERAGADLAALYAADELAIAREHADERVRVGVRAWRVDFDFPKSESVLGALADEATAARIAEIHMEAVRRSMAALESWCAYGMSGHHGDGQRAERVATSGWAATATPHRTARGIGDGTPGDPHDHIHVMVANMVRCADGRWRTVAAGGRDIMRHIPAVGELARAVSRRLITAELGVSYERDAVTGRWEIAGIGADVRAVYSRRATQVDERVGPEATPQQRRAAARATAAPKRAWTPRQERASWKNRALAAGIDPDRLVTSVLGDPGSGAPADRGPDGPIAPDVESVAAAVWDPETGVTAHAKTVTRAKVLAAVAATCPAGVAGPEELEALTDAVLADPRAVALPPGGQAHMTNSARFTSADILTAEQTIIESARRRLGEATATVSADVLTSVLDDLHQRLGHGLSAEQENVVRRLVGAGHGIDLITGVAGAGKTTTMTAARMAWEKAGYRVAGAATAAVAAANLRAEAGIQSRTIASWLQRIDSGQGLRGIDVLVLDEGAMVDDRSLARLITAAHHSATKIVSIGDPRQLKAIGAGGGFARAHRLVGGLHLAHNRRQRDDVDRAALAAWREGAHRTALATWHRNGRLHAAPSLTDTYTEITRRWWAQRRLIDDPHQAVADLLVLAATRAHVDELNHRMRLLARQAGLLGSCLEFAVAGATTVEFAIGDQVRLRANDYRSRRGAGEADVLNGVRGVVTAVDARWGAQVRWRHAGRLQQAWISPQAIARGHLSHGYAITIAAAQGLTSQHCHLLALGADAHAAYAGASRARERVDIYLPAAELETLEQRLRSGPPASDEERAVRTFQAYAAGLLDRDDGMVTDELATSARPPAVSATVVAEPVLTVAEARAGHGPAAAQAAPQIAALREQARQATERARLLQDELVRLSAQATEGGWLRRRTRRRATEQRHAEITIELEQLHQIMRQARAHAHRLHAEAVAADVRQAHHEAERARHDRLVHIAAERGITVEQAARLPQAEIDAALTRALHTSPSTTNSTVFPARSRPSPNAGHLTGPTWLESEPPSQHPHKTR